MTIHVYNIYKISRTIDTENRNKENSRPSVLQ